jgi:hypothetical protein
LLGVIPAEDVLPPAIGYWTEARDGAGNVRRAGSAERPLVVQVVRR